MLLLIHIMAAVVGITYSIVAAIYTKYFNSVIVYFLTAVTTVSGISLTLVNPGGVGKMCSVGLLYLLTVITLTILAKRNIRTTSA